MGGGEVAEIEEPELGSEGEKERERRRDREGCRRRSRPSRLARRDRYERALPRRSLLFCFLLPVEVVFCRIWDRFNLSHQIIICPHVRLQEY